MQQFGWISNKLKSRPMRCRKSQTGHSCSLVEESGPETFVTSFGRNFVCLIYTKYYSVYWWKNGAERCSENGATPYCFKQEFEFVNIFLCSRILSKNNHILFAQDSSIGLQIFTLGRMCNGAHTLCCTGIKTSRVDHLY